MNKRILKKLCKRAAPLLPLLGDRRQQFRVDSEWQCDSWSRRRMDRKSYERWSGKINEHHYYAPLHGTIGVGATSGYEEPEWDDQPALEALRDSVFVQCMTYPSGDFESWLLDSKLDRKLYNPSQILAAARDMADRLAERKAGGAL